MSKKKTKTKRKKRIAMIRVRGKVHVRKCIEDTLKLLNLTRTNHCVVIDDRPQYMGMINKVNDYVTWGEINGETFKKLLRERGELVGNKNLDDMYLKEKTNYKSLKEFSDSFMKFNSELRDIPNLKPVFRLNPPKKGYERGGIKKPYTKGGALGYRGEKINELIERMIYRDNGS
ncbi:MAG: 50S ribosomal protein L30 [Candidatus Altiarchaeales archaeon]|nr:MAG: 50S ribosomal protein L30 [Candidatus Altiarchaeales archaeon]HDI73179.1 50S ribosomal protein L30 [Candidatus Altiarchaeales archaeon]